ncbi:MAG TPA: hypothetical protein VGB69_01835, partial [Edaphobacter sp.]
MESPTMDLFAGLDARDAGITLAEQKRKDLVRRVRQRVVLAAKANGGCATADDFEKALNDLGKTYADLGNAAGGIFRTGEWIRTDQFVQSKRK